MQPLKSHFHNDTDSPKLYAGESIINCPQESITVVSGTADATYSSNEQTMINDLKDTVNDLLTKLQNIGIIK